MRVKVKVDNGWCWVYNGSMKIEFGLMSVVSLAYLLTFGLVGDVEMLSIDIGFSLTRDTLDVTIDPVWAVWVPERHIRNGNAFAFGNIIVMGDWARENLYGEYLLAHESNHVEQFHALGSLIFPAQFIVRIEPQKWIMQDWNDPSQPDKIMWLPEKGAKHRWHFMTVSI